MSQTSPPQLTFEVSTPGRQSYSVTLRKSQNIVGRESGDIVLNDAETSALHAEIDSTAGHVIVRDLGSSNGTWREGERLPQFALYEGQSFYCGNTELRLVKVQGPGSGLHPGQTAVGRTVEAKAGPAPRSRTIQGSPHGEPSPVAPPPGWSPPASPPTPPSLGQPAPITTPPAPSSATLKGYAATPPQAGAPQPGPAQQAPSPSTLSAAPSASAPPSDLKASEVATAPPASRGTLPGGNAPSSTATIGDAKQTSSSSTVPGAAPGAPPVAGASAPAPSPAVPDAPTPASASAPTPASKPAPEPASTPTAEPGSEPVAFRSAVANAVIQDPSRKKSKRPDGASPASSPAKGPRRWPRLLVIGGLTAAGVSALAGVAYLLWTLWAGRGVAFVEDVAEQLPDTALGVLAVASPADAVALFGDEVPEEFREQTERHLSFDAFDAEGWSAMGVDPKAPVGVALLAVDEPVIAISAGVSDVDKLKATLEGKLAPFVAPTQETLLWSQRTFGDSDGLWLTEPPIALVLRDDRATLVLSPENATAEEISRQAEAIAAAEGDKSLAGGEGFGELTTPKGKTLAMLYADGSSIRGALPGTGLGVMAVRMALADLDAVALSLSTDGGTIHGTSQVVVRDGSRHLEMVDGQSRDQDALRRIKAPVFAAMDGSFDADTFDRALGGAASMWGGSLPVIEQEFSDAVGLDLRGDVTQNLAGDFGLALVRLPSKARATDFGAIVWAGVADEERARASAERLFAKLGAEFEELGVVPLQVDDTLVYSRPANDDRGEPQVQAFIAAGHVWFAFGDVDAASIIKSPDASFLDNTDHKAVRTALAKGGHVAGFVDIAGVVEGIRPLLSPRELEELEAADPVLSLLEVATMRSEVRGRAIVTQTSLHTTETDGLAALVQAAVKRQGEELTASLASATHAKRCAQLAEHVGELSRVALKDAGAGLEMVWEIERKILEACDGPTMTPARLSCYLDTETIDGLKACDAKHPVKVADPPVPPEVDDTGATPDPDPTPGAEPKKVPYVDDIWPHLGDDPDSENPQPEVNYAVPVGPDPDTRGPADALVTIIMFGDFQCPHCKAVVNTLDEVLAEHGDNVRLVFRHHPLEKIHPAARVAAQVALAAGKQGKFWEMHDVLFANQTRLGDADENEELYTTFATEVGLDLGQLKTDRAAVDIERRLARDAEAAKKFGVQGTPAFFVNGRYLGGRQTRSAFNAIIGEERERAERFVARRGGTRVRLYEDMISHFAPEVLQPTVGIEVPDADAKRYSIEVTDMPSKGATTFAQVQIIECGDFDCPYCARSRKALDDVLDAYPTQVALYFAHSPRDFHPGAEPAARAAVAAGKQDKFWEMHDELFKGQQADARSDTDYITYARRLGLDIDDFKRDMAAPATAELVAAQKKLCEDNDGTATPTFFVNGRRVIGAKKFEQFKALVDAELAAGI